MILIKTGVQYTKLKINGSTEFDIFCCAFTTSIINYLGIPLKNSDLTQNSKPLDNSKRKSGYFQAFTFFVIYQ